MSEVTGFEPAILCVLVRTIFIHRSHWEAGALPYKLNPHTLFRFLSTIVLSRIYGRLPRFFANCVCSRIMRYAKLLPVMTIGVSFLTFLQQNAFHLVCCFDQYHTLAVICFKNFSRKPPQYTNGTTFGVDCRF
jgi:hypothetical protein